MCRNGVQSKDAHTQHIVVTSCSCGAKKSSFQNFSVDAPEKHDDEGNNHKCVNTLQR